MLPGLLADAFHGESVELMVPVRFQTADGIHKLLQQLSDAINGWHTRAPPVECLSDRRAQLPQHRAKIVASSSTSFNHSGLPVGSIQRHTRSCTGVRAYLSVDALTFLLLARYVPNVAKRSI